MRCMEEEDKVRNNKDKTTFFFKKTNKPIFY